MQQMLANFTFGKAVIVGAVLAGIYYSVFYDSGVNIELNIEKLDKQKTEGEKRINEVRQAIADAERYQETIKQLGGELKRITQAIPKDMASIELMKIVSSQAKSVGASINKLADTTKTAQANTNKRKKKDEPEVIYEPLTVSLEISGTYNQVMTFLSNLTKVDRLLTANGLKLLVKDVKNPQVPNVVMTAEVSGYRFIEPEPVKEDPKKKKKPAAKKEEG